MRPNWKVEDFLIKKTNFFPRNSVDDDAPHCITWKSPVFDMFWSSWELFRHKWKTCDHEILFWFRGICGPEMRLCLLTRWRNDSIVCRQEQPRRKTFQLFFFLLSQKTSKPFLARFRSCAEIVVTVVIGKKWEKKMLKNSQNREKSVLVPQSHLRYFPTHQRFQLTRHFMNGEFAFSRLLSSDCGWKRKKKVFIVVVRSSGVFKQFFRCSTSSRLAFFCVVTQWHRRLCLSLSQLRMRHMWSSKFVINEENWSEKSVSMSWHDFDTILLLSQPPPLSPVTFDLFLSYIDIARCSARCTR